MTVVRNELDRGENEPARVLDERIWATAFREHPYHHPTIGWRSDVEGVPTARLKEFYDVYYHPNNAVALVVGDFEEQQALDLIAKHFGKIPAAAQEIPPMYTVEPPQEGENRLVLRRAGQLGIVEVAWRIPEAKHLDALPLSVLDTILSAGITSRLYQALVETELALDEGASAASFLDPGLFTIEATLTPGGTHEEVERVIYTEIEKLKVMPVSEAELRKAKNMMLTQMIYQQDSCMSIARGLSEAEVVIGWQHYVDFPRQLETVTPEDIQRVVQTYFTEDNRTVGWFIPKEEELSHETVSLEVEEEQIKLQLAA
jgi:zinc protease